MRNFIIFFNEKEGSTPVVHLLNEFKAVSVVHQGQGGWEPFDAHKCGAMPIRKLERCLRLVYGSSPVDMDALNGVYTATATGPLVPIEPKTAVGFKMRFRPPSSNPLRIPTKHRVAKRLRRAVQKAQHRRFRRRMLAVLHDCDVTAFVVVRQDLLRWALSKYHGDGTGRPGHLQFAVATGRIERDTIERIHVDLDKFRRIIRWCKRDHERKRELLADLESAGVRTAVLRYEDFVSEPAGYFARLLEALDLEADAAEIDAVLARGTRFEKVHSDDLSEFVENHQEVVDAFGGSFVRW